MNSLSLFIYLSDVLVNLQTMTVILTIVGGVAAVFILLFHGIENEEIHPKWYNIFWLLIPFTFAMLIPSKTSMNMIAASQIGEQIIQLEEVQEIGGEVGGLAKDAINLLRQNIQQQLTEKAVGGEN